MVYRATVADSHCSQCPLKAWIVVLIGSRPVVEIRFCERCAESMRDHIEAFQRSGGAPS